MVPTWTTEGLNALTAKEDVVSPPRRTQRYPPCGSKADVRRLHQRTRSEQNDPPLEDLQAPVTSKSEMPSTPESLEEETHKPPKNFLQKLRDQI